MIQQISQILQALNENEDTIGIFIDLSKAFDTDDYHLLLQQLKWYKTKNNDLKWFQSYLSDRKQLTKFNSESENLEIIWCSIALPFLIFVNYLKRSSKFLDLIIFADGTNLFYSNRDINTLFKIANEELNESREWFRASKLSINAGKTNNIFFLIQRVSLYLEKSIYFSFIHSYISYCNIVWASTPKTKLTRIFTKQKHAFWIIYSESKYVHSKLFMQKMNA